MTTINGIRRSSSPQRFPPAEPHAVALQPKARRFCRSCRGETVGVRSMGRTSPIKATGESESPSIDPLFRLPASPPGGSGARVARRRLAASGLSWRPSRLETCLCVTVVRARHYFGKKFLQFFFFAPKIF